MIIVCFLLAIFFILVIVMLCRTYQKDIFELEYRILQLEKRLEEYKKQSKIDFEFLFEHLEVFNVEYKKRVEKEGECTMACKKGRGGKKK